MAHGKETPRQKMIGMMYLVLMALLALNVSKEVLDAFVLVDESLTKTTENSATKNELYYSRFEMSAAENPVKAGPWKAKADEVKRQSDALYVMIQDLKVEIVKATDGDKAKALVEPGHLNTELIAGKDNSTVPAEIMIGADMNGKGFELKGAIANYRETLKSFISEEALEKRASLDSILNTEDPPYSDKHGTITWEQEHFEHLPMVAVITMMSKFQSDVRNAESEILEYLYSQIEEGFTFNYIEPVVLANSNYLIRGNDYTASVFMAAFDTTQQPKVYIGQYDSTITDQGVVDYYMKGELGRDYDSIRVVGGRGVYSVKTSATGFKSWGGLISLKNMDGSLTNRPFHAEYRVGEPALIVSPTKMNVFYQGLENPISVSVPGTPQEQLSASVSNGRITGSGGSYVVVPTRVGSCDVSVTARMEGAARSLGSVPFRVKETPDPYPTLAGERTGTVAKSDVLKELGLVATMPEWFEFNITYTITGYEFSITVGQFSQRENATSGDFTTNIRNLIRGAAAGTRLYFNDIKAVGPDGKERNIGSLSVKLR
jgi:gliding motility-associated protein GldM